MEGVLNTRKKGYTEKGRLLNAIEKKKYKVPKMGTLYLTSFWEPITLCM